LVALASRTGVVAKANMSSMSVIDMQVAGMSTVPGGVCSTVM
jgi:hypothetical protein